jgi:uncharacterized tellurite resistance protein B-like protein
MVKMTVADGELDARERALLESVASKHSVPPDRLEQMIAAAQSDSLDVPEPADQTEARQHLMAMARAACADGKITRQESAILSTAGQRLGLSDSDVDRVVKQARKTLYQESKAQLKGWKNGNGNGNP